MERFGWATIHEVTENGFYAYRSANRYRIAKENLGVVDYDCFSKQTGVKVSYLKKVLVADFGAMMNEDILFESKEQAEAARDWLESMYICKKAAAAV